MAVPSSVWKEQGYHLAGIVITFLCAWVGILVAVTVDKCNSKATSVLSMFAGGVLLAGGMIHLLSDSLDILRAHSVLHGQFTALLTTCSTYVVLLVLNAAVNTYFGARLQRIQKKTDRVRLLSDTDGDDLPTDRTVDKHKHTDEAVIFIASLQKSGLRSSVLLMLLLSLHSFLAGLAFGSQPDPAEEFKIMLPISAHKSLSAMALALAFRTAKIPPIHMYSLLLVFSLSTPFGTFAGMVITTSVQSSAWTGICLAIAAGAFIFVTLNDIIPTELSRHSDLVVVNCAALILGFLLMSLLALWV